MKTSEVKRPLIGRTGLQIMLGVSILGLIASAIWHLPLLCGVCMLTGAWGTRGLPW